ncbi:Two-component response regulator-like APRR7 [Vitis vinifera]|uniref:Two-component response regulator-like APRR7 n=1 Tax=Vitis vinifera TaxID=29760 RepID=A0A438DW45_VITVI|nr:Two-component response regulator-like APRR7 [Vitis vinifera]
MNGDGKIGLPDPGQCGEDGKDIKARDGDEVPSADGEGDDVSDDEESMDCYEALVLMKSRVLLVEMMILRAIFGLHAVMSTHDSGALVLKCLSKGATDFLVKPVRKNELKFLWQHIWRRRQNNGFPCGSKGDTQDLKPKSDGDSNFQPQQQ